MHRIMISIGLGLFCAVGVCLRSSEACSPALCQGGMLLPHEQDQVVPVNADAFLWRPRQEIGQSSVTANDISLVRVSDNKAVEIDVAPYAGKGGLYAVVVKSKLQPNTQYELRPKNLCTNDPEKNAVLTRFKTSAEDAAPASAASKLGKIKVSAMQKGPLQLASGAGSCTEKVEAAYVKVEVVLDASAKTWAPLYTYMVQVDNKPWAPAHTIMQDMPIGGGWEGRGKDLIYTSCDPNLKLSGAQAGVAPNVPHQIRFLAGGPSWAALLPTDPISVTLSCDAVVQHDGSVPSTDGGVVADMSSGGQDAGQPDQRADGDPQWDATVGGDGATPASGGCSYHSEITMGAASGLYDSMMNFFLPLIILLGYFAIRRWRIDCT